MIRDIGHHLLMIENILKVELGDRGNVKKLVVSPVAFDHIVSSYFKSESCVRVLPSDIASFSLFGVLIRPESRHD